MRRTRFTPDNQEHWLKLRAADLTSTEVSALFGCSPYCTPFELWHRKQSGDLGRIEENERMVWGNRLQDVIAKGIGEDMGFQVRRLNQYMRIEGLRLGSSFDYEVVDHPDGPGILEVKNVDALVFRDGWLVGDDGEVEAPPHIELQVQHQMLVSGRTWCVIAALVGGNRVVTIYRKFDEQICARILTVAEAFWVSVDQGVEPQPDYARDADVIKRLYSHAEPGKVFDACGDERIETLIAEYKRASNDEAKAGERKEAARSELLTIIGDAEKVVTNLGSISAGIVGEAEVAYTRKPYRNFRVTLKKGVNIDVMA